MTLTMRVDRHGLPPRLDWPAAAALWAERAAPLGTRMLRSHAPMLTGKLRESIRDRREISPGLAVIMFYTQVDYAKWVLGGTRPHVIRVKNARALRWVANRGHGPVRYAMQVQHPGTKANDFPVEAMRIAGPGISHLFAEAVKETMGL